MDPVTIGFIASTALSVGSKIFGGMAANKAAEKAAEEQAKFTGEQRAEEIRQLQLTNAQNLGAAKAAAYAGNIQAGGGSTNRYLTTMDMENMRQISAAKYARKKEMEAILEGGQGVGNGMFYEAAGDLLGAAASGFAARYSPGTPGVNPRSPTLSNPALKGTLGE
jgi:hypothetical protein